MPVIRQGPDTTLADTLGNLGSAVTNVLNPLNQVRAQNFVSEIQQRAFELHQKQVFDDANRQAADAWERNNPWNEDPATLAAHAAGIRAGQPDFKGTADALIATANQGARSAAANLFRSRHQTDMDPDAVESGAADIQAGRKNASEVETDYNTGRLKKGEADTTGAFVTAAGAPGATVSSITGPAAAAAAARGNVEGATKSVAQGQDLSTPPPSGAAADITTPEGAAAFDTASKIRQIAGTGVAGQPPSAAFVPQQEATDVNKKILESRAAVHPLDQGASAVSGPVVVGAGPNAGVVSAPAQPPNVPAITDVEAAKAAAATQAKGVNEYAQSQIQQGIEEDRAGQQMISDINEMRRLSKIIYNDRPLTEAENAIAAHIYERFGITLSPQQDARAVFDNYRSALMASWRVNEGITRLAGPEIQVSQLGLPGAQMSYKAVNEALDRFEVKARLGSKIGQAALRAWNKGINTGNMPGAAEDFMNERSQIMGAASDTTTDIRTKREDQEQPKPAPTNKVPRYRQNPDGSFTLQP